MQKRSTNNFACFLCDYALYLLVTGGADRFDPLFIFPHRISGFGLFPALPPSGEPRRLPQQLQASQITPAITNASTIMPAQPTVTCVVKTENRATSGAGTNQTQASTSMLGLPSIETQANATVTETNLTNNVTPSPARPPEYVVALIPVHWKETRQEFIDAANRQGDFFRQTSEVENYFHVKNFFFEVTYSEGKPTDSDLLGRMLVWTIQRDSADRHIGLTDGALATDNNTWIVGYTFGIDTQGMLAETTEDTIAAHELGHTYGLCDEYNFDSWDEKNKSLSDRCPNPYPSDCPKNTGVVNECNGTPSNNGKMALMASSSSPDQSAYNETFQEHLAEFFQQLTQKAR